MIKGFYLAKKPEMNNVTWEDVFLDTDFSKEVPIEGLDMSTEELTTLKRYFTKKSKYLVKVVNYNGNTDLYFKIVDLIKKAMPDLIFFKRINEKKMVIAYENYFNKKYDDGFGNDFEILFDEIVRITTLLLLSDIYDSDEDIILLLQNFKDKFIAYPKKI